jgi:DNA-binding NarL/FixJ family response regulator
MIMTTIVLADDHPVVRQGLRALLEREPGLSIIGETGDGVEAALLAERLQPDVLVTDMAMPGLNGAEITRQVRHRAPRTQVVILSMHDAEPYVVEALRAGALAYVLKESTAQELVQAVRSVAAGRRYLSAPLSDRAIAAYAQRASEQQLGPLAMLTPREREVLLLVAQGHTNREIAARLVVSQRTVEAHRSNVMAKLGLRNHMDLLRFALENGLVPPET